MQERVECETCKEVVKKTNWNQRFCSYDCSEKHRIKEHFRKWVEKKPRKLDPDRNGRIERARVYHSTGGWMNKFSGYRG